MEISELKTTGRVYVAYPEELRVAVTHAVSAWEAFCELPDEVKSKFPYEVDKKTSGTWHTMIYNETGQMIDLQSINAPQGNITHRIALDKSLPSGYYFINILDETSLIRSNGRFVKL